MAVGDLEARARRMATPAPRRESRPPPIDDGVADAWARLRVAPRAAGRRMPVNDSWIAATAIAAGIPVATQDEDHDDVPGLTVIRLWGAIASCSVRLVIARCSVDYVGRLTAHLPSAVRLLMIKADGSISVHADGRAYKPLNWMSPPCAIAEEDGVWRVTNRADEQLVITVEEIMHDSAHDLGHDPGLVKDGVEAHLQVLLAERPDAVRSGLTLVRREYETGIGPVDLLCRDADGSTVAVEIKRRGEIDGVEQLTRYLARLEADPLLPHPVTGILAAQSVTPQARLLAADRGMTCVTVDYDALRGLAPANPTLF